MIFFISVLYYKYVASQHLTICWPVVNLARPALRTWKRIHPLSSQRFIVWRSTPSSSAASRWLYLPAGSQLGLVDTISGNCKFQPIRFTAESAVFHFLHGVGRVFLAIQIVAVLAGNSDFFTVAHRAQTLAGNFFGNFFHFSVKTLFVCLRNRKNCLPLPVESCVKTGLLGRQSFFCPFGSLVRWCKGRCFPLTSKII